MGNMCKKECIDKGKNFCANSNWSAGYCCDKSESCPRSSVCSNDNPRAPAIFKYFSCPNEAACGTKEITPKYSSEVITRSIDKYTYNFVENDVCGYVIHAP